MLSKRIIPCLDVRDGRLTKGIKFKENVDIGDPVEAARAYYEQGADEIVFYDITASAEGRAIMLDVVKRVAETIFIPFSVGGGIRTVDDMRQVILAGAEKVSVNSEAVKNPGIIAEGARAFGSQCIVLGMDVKKVHASNEIPSGYEIVIHGGLTFTGLDSLRWAKEAERLLAALAPRDLLVLLDEKGRERTSAEFASDLRSWLDSSPSAVVFAVGGAFGLDPVLRPRARAILPLSRMTLPHQLARLVLTEQVYRATAALSGVAYSK